jgi:hypothetical protein
MKSQAAYKCSDSYYLLISIVEPIVSNNVSFINIHLLDELANKVSRVNRVALAD